MVGASYLRAKARQCRHLADIATNLELRKALDELAQEFEERAVQATRRTQQQVANQARQSSQRC